MSVSDIMAARLMKPTGTERSVQDFYDREGWTKTGDGVTDDARRWEDLRPCARDYVSACRRRLTRHLPDSGKLILDAASGPVQYPEYLEYSAGFGKRVCVDISTEALLQARQRIGTHGAYARATILALPFPTDAFDAVVSLHTIYHVDEGQQETAVRELIRVARPGAPVVILYSNPDRWLYRLKQLVAPSRRQHEQVIYFHAHPLKWWQRFADTCSVTLHPNRVLAAQESQLLIPAFASGVLFPLLMSFEERLPGFALRAGAYPTIVLVKGLRATSGV